MTMIAFLQVSTRAPDFVAAIHAHYSGSRGAPPGQKLAWRIVEDGRTIGWIGLGEAPYKLSPLRRLGIADARPPRTAACCFIYRLEDRAVRHTSASAILRAWHPIARQEWERRKGHPLVHWITMVDPSRVQSVVPGACFRRAGYRPLGMTTGRSRRRPVGHGCGKPAVWCDSTPKLVLYRGPLSRKPREDNS